MPRQMLAVALVLLAATACVEANENWPQFRGPEGNAVVQEEFPQKWNAKSNVRWKTDVTGEGWSAPVVWDKRLLLTAAIMTKKPAGGQQSAQDRPGRRQRGGNRRRGGGYQNDLANAEFRWEIQCLDTSNGDVIWRHVTREGKPSQGRHMQNTYASETPVTDGKRVYARYCIGPRS